MAEINTQEIKKLKTGELVGSVATAFCGVALIYFIIAFSVGTALDISALRLSALIASPVLIAAGAGAAAFCNIKYGGALDKLMKNYVRDVFIENAALMHPERDSLTFFILAEKDKAEIKVNSYKEKIVFDFTPFGKLSALRRSFAVSAIADKLSQTFCKLAVERGVNFKSVCYTADNGKKQSKQVKIIENGEPEKRALKNYLKNK